MSDLWRHLEERSADWDAIRRQELADAVWFHYVTARFGRTGDPRALNYLYPYLAQAATRHQAIRIAAGVFEGRGASALEHLQYFVSNPDPFLRDRAVNIVAAAVTGSRTDVILRELSPYLHSANQFVRRQAVAAIGKAARGQACPDVLAEILRVSEATPAIGGNLRMASISLLYQGAPTEEVYRLVVQPEKNWRSDIVEFDFDAEKVGWLAMGAGTEWFERLCEDVIAPMLVPDVLPKEEGHGWMRGMRQREGIDGLSTGGAGRGMQALELMLRVRCQHSPMTRMMEVAQRCFIGASPDDQINPLCDLLREGDVPTQRVAAVCLGRLTMGEEREDVVGLLADQCSARNGAVRAAAIRGLSLAARSTSDKSIQEICLRLAQEPETARAAIRALGTVYLGTGSSDAFGDILDLAADLRSRPVRGKKHSKPLSACYFAAGLIYAGTGSREPVEFLVDGVGRPRESQHMAARGLVMTDFPESRLGEHLLGIDEFHPMQEDLARIAPEDW